MDKIITRFAPSPTGYIHIGNVRSAIFPYLAAKQSSGKFILRIEDTDRSRFVDGATDLIMETLRWLGLEWDEGPEIGGPNAPYFQSERKEIYQDWAKKLLKSGRAYIDDTSSETIDEYRKTDNAKKIPFLYRNHRPASADLSPEESLKLWKEGTPIRFKSDPKPRSWKDEVMGDLSAGPEVQDDIILIKKDGLPTYNFAHIVDDTLMNINMVARGVEYLSSTPNYLALYEALDVKKPLFVSLPHILAPQGNKKLSKRDGAKSVTEYRADGILPEAMLNYLACLGWNDGTEQEIYTKDELIERFSVSRIQNSGARFDETKLLWMNGQWIRKLVDEEGIDKFFPRTLDFWPDSAKSYDDDYKKRVLAIIYDRLKTLSDLREMTDYFFTDPKINVDLLTSNRFLKKLSEAELESLLETTISSLETISEDSWNEETLKNTLNSLLEATNKKPAELFSLIRISVSFAPFSPALDLTLSVLGRTTTLSRLRAVKSALLLDGE
ncbi:glutamate--tRNA ligase [Candidatus Saccharibacteria bacterium]|nr:glutamate--tRNA ligase [Candidatus Saccharibacteria bacterium]